MPFIIDIGNGSGKPKHLIHKIRYNYHKNRALERAKLNKFYN
jgi:hypothetical protein